MKKNLLIGLFLIITLLPLGAGLCYSIFYSLGFSGVIGKGLTLEYWKEILFSGEFLYSLMYSLLIGIITVVISFSLAFLLYPLVRQSKYNGQLLMFIPLCVPPMVWAFFHYVVFTGSGLISRLAYSVGMIHGPADFPVLVNDQFGITVILTHVVMVVPFFILYFIRIHQSENIDELSLLASSFGATKTKVKLKVALPVLMYKSRVMLVLYLIFVAGSYEVPLLLGGQSPRMITVFILDKMQKFSLDDKPVAYGAAFLYVVLMVIIILFSVNKMTLAQDGKE
ncbi:sulfate ABC transporter permease [Marinigracilibium pacificum]|uniref:Sulfate ABC transporter permease n=1 Tax=Marinigracilibium pacificum TaxID=2729599 RepID=A0A848J6Y5_9BACT|nr:sulfate ABC transporter permease [Marinigracilibium pacificum]NMM48872.1 sulfate ABC transporter permease [Marinigracilibium pacificum]